MCKDCGLMFGYKEAHQLHDLPFNADFIRTTLDYLTQIRRKDDWRFNDEWSWIATGVKHSSINKNNVDHEGIWSHYLSHADPKRYGKITSVGPDGTIYKPCGKVCEYQKDKK